jgi:hypothetical protein
MKMKLLVNNQKTRLNKNIGIIKYNAIKYTPIGEQNIYNETFLKIEHVSLLYDIIKQDFKRFESNIINNNNKYYINDMLNDNYLLNFQIVNIEEIQLIKSYYNKFIQYKIDIDFKQNYNPVISNYNNLSNRRKKENGENYYSEVVKIKLNTGDCYKIPVKQTLDKTDILIYRNTLQKILQNILKYGTIHLNVSKRIDNNITCKENDNIYITNILEIYQ